MSKKTVSMEKPEELERRLRMESSRKPFTLHKAKQTGFLVQKKMCPTCIYRPDSPLDLEKLEEQVRDEHMGFKGHRICHCSPTGMDVCCRGFWEAHKDEFPAGQIAQRLGLVAFVDVKEQGKTQPPRKKRLKTAPNKPETPSGEGIPEETLRKAVEEAFLAGRSEFDYPAVCRAVLPISDRLPVNMYKQQKRAAK